MRFVDVPAASSDARVSAVDARDPEDAPLAELATLLAPAVVLTRDRHLTMEGIGLDDWLTTVLVLRELVEIDEMLWGSSRATFLAVYLPALAVRGLGRRVIRSELALGAVIGIAIGAVAFLRSQLRVAATDAWNRIAPVVEQLSEFLTETIEREARAQSWLNSRLVMPVGSATPEGVAARLLAQRCEPLSSEELHHAAERAGLNLSLPAMRKRLRMHPAFVGVPGQGYELGRSLSTTSAIPSYKSS